MKGQIQAIVLIYITNHVIAELILTPANKEVVRYEGENYMVTCERPLAMGNLSEVDPPLWILPSGTDLGNTTRYKVEIYHHEDLTGSILTLTNLTMEDAGTYVCVDSSDTSTQNSSISRRFTLHVYQPIVFRNKPTVYITSGIQDSVTCNVSGNPKPKISWFIDLLPITSNHFPKYKYSANKRTLYIRQVTRIDRGQYRCRAEQITPYFGTFAESNILVKVKYGPVWISPTLYRVSAKMLDPISLKCAVDSEPSSTVEWTKIGASNEINWNIVDPIRRNEQTLNFTVKSDLDSGTYLCTAVNEISSRQRMVQLRQDPRDVEINARRVSSKATFGTPNVSALTAIIMCQLLKGKPIYLTIVLCILMTHYSYCIIGFHCTNSRTNLTTISLTELGSCPEINPNIKTSRVRMQVLQKRTYDYAPYMSCKIHTSLI